LKPTTMGIQLKPKGHYGYPKLEYLKRDGTGFSDSVSQREKSDSKKLSEEIANKGESRLGIWVIVGGS